MRRGIARIVIAALLAVSLLTFLSGGGANAECLPRPVAGLSACYFSGPDAYGGGASVSGVGGGAAVYCMGTYWIAVSTGPISQGYATGIAC